MRIYPTSMRGKLTLIAVSIMGLLFVVLGGIVQLVGRAEIMGGVDAELVPAERKRVRLVEGGPKRDAVAKGGEHGSGVGREIVHAPGGQPPFILVLQRLRQVPVVQRDVRLDAGRGQLVQQVRVEADAVGVEGRAAARGEQARPRQREPERRHPQPLHEGDVVLEAVVEVAGDVAGVAVFDLKETGGGGKKRRRSKHPATLSPSSLLLPSLLTLPLVCENVSQMDGPLPPARAPPSI